jgi:hypothetical protein
MIRPKAAAMAAARRQRRKKDRKPGPPVGASARIVEATVGFR